MSEGATHLGIARARAPAGVPGRPSAGPPVDEDAVRSILQEVMDPELPMVSIVDMGMVGAVSLDGEGIRVEILPTFVGCPVVELVRSTVTERLGVLGRPVSVVRTFMPPWSSERITPAGRAALASVGIASPTEIGDVRCPLCDSARVVMDNLFGPTPCRSLYYCRDCRQPFEAIKLV